MKVLLHGAINGTNFGDCLFAALFYNKLSGAFGPENVFFYDIKPFGIGNHLRKTLNYYKKIPLDKYKDIDALVYISGGYFGDNNKSLRGSIIRYFRYVSIGLYAIRNNIKIYVVGLEVGPLHYKFVKKAILRILSNSKINIVRNKESFDYLEKNGITNKKCTADTAISLSKEDFNPFASTYVKNFVKHINKKILFLHMLPYEEIDNHFVEVIINPIIKFINENHDYCVVYGTDGGKKCKDFGKLDMLFKQNNITCFEYRYSNIYDMCYLLNAVSIIVTRKLHVGIVGSVLNKSVVSTPMHLYKTARFYKQIGEEKRCISFKNLSEDTVYNLLSEYKDIPIDIPDYIKDSASSNINLLMEYMRKDIKTDEI